MYIKFIVLPLLLPYYFVLRAFNPSREVWIV